MDKEMTNVPEEDAETEFLGDLIELTDEDGVKHEFELVDTLEKNGTTYIALVTVPDDAQEVLDSDGNLIIMKVVSEDGEDDVLSMIEDEDEFDEISEIFVDRLSDLYEFEGDECDCDECSHEHGCDCGHDHN